MHSTDTNNVVKLCGHFERKPNAPAESNNIELGMSLFLEIFGDSCESFSHNLRILVFNACNDEPHVHISIVRVSKQFREIDVVPKC